MLIYKLASFSDHFLIQKLEMGMRLTPGLAWRPRSNIKAWMLVQQIFWLRRAHVRKIPRLSLFVCAASDGMQGLGRRLMLHHTILALDQGYDTLLVSGNFLKAHFNCHPLSTLPALLYWKQWKGAWGLGTRLVWSHHVLHFTMLTYLLHLHFTLSSSLPSLSRFCLS